MLRSKIGLAIGSFVAGISVTIGAFEIRQNKLLNRIDDSHSLNDFPRFGLPVVQASSPPNPPALPPQIMKWGHPDVGAIKYREGYILSYDRRNKTANWVCEHITLDRLNQKNAKRDESQFKEDESDPEIFRARITDYRGSGYDRGHLAPAGNHKISEKAMNDTFYLSNMSPQVGKGFNRNKWSELEMYVRDLTKINKNVYICTGPLYIPRKEADGNTYIHYRVIGNGNVAVPTHFFKIAVCEKESGEISIESYIMPNEPIPDAAPLKLFRVPLIEVEKRSGFLFYNNIPDKYKKIVL